MLKTVFTYLIVKGREVPFLRAIGNHTFVCGRTFCSRTDSIENETLTEAQIIIDPTEKTLISRRTPLLCNTLQCNENDAKELIDRNIYLLVKNKETISKRANFLQTLFTLEDIKTYPQLLTLPLGPIEQQYHIMRDFGFNNILCSTLLEYSRIIKKCPEELIQLGYMEETCDPLQEVLTVLSSTEFAQQVNEELSPQHYMTSPLLSLHRSLLPKYLAHRFSTSLQQGRFIVRLHHELSGRSFSNIKECFTILEEIFLFNLAETRLSPYLLHQEPSNLRAIAALPSLMGGDTLTTARRFPKVLAKPVQDILQVEAILREKGLTDETLQTCGYLFRLTPETVRDLIIKRKLKRMIGR